MAIKKVTGGSAFLPEWVHDESPEESLDTPEHRFVRYALEQIANHSQRVVSRFAKRATSTLEVREVGRRSEDAVQQTFLSEVGAMASMPYTSRVLQRAAGYRELSALWRSLNSSFDPFWSLEHALEVRDVAELYEWWCFFALSTAISKALGCEMPEVHVRHDDEGLERDLQLDFPHNLSLAYNREFSPGSRRWRSYSVRLRPDFVVSRFGKPVTAFDAKFRFDSLDFTTAALDDPGEGDAGISVERIAKKADLYKMHTYKDALGLRASIVLFPGREGELRFYREDRLLGNPSLAELLLADCPKGVGALPMSPEDFNW